MDAPLSWMPGMVAPFAAPLHATVLHLTRNLIRPLFNEATVVRRWWRVRRPPDRLSWVSEGGQGYGYHGL